ncbi:hypothetical protein [Nocardia sp. XZ_19_385]|uniref:hypothetical protein n=1 Tax=Nocardia sp. XZ_19_385 TaxID=2769488 RepID=UPI00188ECF50|nr:hypothetical protein [Nocardia sp. XZ_19_385]
MNRLQLWFPVREIAPLAEHAMNSPYHANPFTEPGQHCPPALVLARDDGVYLFSNGYPRQVAPDLVPPRWGVRHVRAASVDFGSVEDGHGDDFADYLDLTSESESDRVPLHRLIRTYARVEAWMTLSVSPRGIVVGFQRSGPETDSARNQKGHL